MRKRALSLLLVLTMLLGMVPVYAVGTGADTKGEILSFDALEQGEYTASLGTIPEEIGLPEKLTATVNEPVTTITGMEDGEMLTSVHTEKRELQVPVTWSCEDYQLANEGSYTFTARAEGYTLADGAEWPTVTVTLEHRLADPAASLLAEETGEILYVSSKGTAAGDGSRENPMDLDTAIQALSDGSGGTIYVMDDISYKRDIADGTTPSITKDITLTTDPAAGGVATLWTTGVGTLAVVGGGAKLTIQNLIVDGGNVGSNAIFIIGTTSDKDGTPGHLELGDGAVLRNCRTAFGPVWTNRNSNTTVTLKSGAVISGNRADTQRGTAAPTEQNYNHGHGGGVTLRGGTLTMEEGSKITGNTAVNGGGGVFVQAGATFNMTGGEIAGNNAPTAGGVYVNGGAFTMGAAASITDNRATGTAAQQGGGGVLVASAADFKPAVTISGRVVGNSSANAGGGVYVLSGGATLNGATVIGNQSEGYGGGVFLDDRNADAALTLSGKTTIINNVSRHAEAQEENNLTLVSSAALRRSVTLDGLAAGSRVGVSHLMADSWMTETGLFAALKPDSITQDSLAQAPKCFTSDNPSFSVAQALLPGQIGVGLVRSQGIYVSPSRGNDESNDGTRAYPYRTLQKAISAAGRNGTVIYVMDDMSETITKQPGHPGLGINNNSLTITTDPELGKRATVTLLGDGGFYVNGALTLHDIIFDGAKRQNTVDENSAVVGPFGVMNGTFMLGDGAVIQNFTANTPAVYEVEYPTLPRTFTIEAGAAITGNTMIKSSEPLYIEGTGGTPLYLSADGGGVGVTSTSGKLIMSGGTISGNTAPNGGGVYVAKDAAFEMTGGEIAGNHGTNGGGVYTEGTFTAGADTRITGNDNGGGVHVAGGKTVLSGAITGNTSTNFGGAVSMTGGDVTVSGTITGNTGTAAVYAQGGSLLVKDVEITGNTGSSEQWWLAGLYSWGNHQNANVTCTLEGRVVIRDNVAKVGGESNLTVRWDGDRPFTIGEGGLSEGSDIGVNIWEGGQPGAAGPFATGAKADVDKSEQYFHYDGTKYTVLNNGEGTLSLGYAKNNYYVSSKGDDATGDGTPEKPFATVQKALEKAGKGEPAVIHIMDTVTVAQNRIEIGDRDAAQQNWTVTLTGTGPDGTPYSDAALVGEGELKGDGSNVYGMIYVGQATLNVDHLTLKGAEEHNTRAIRGGTGSTVNLNDGTVITEWNTIPVGQLGAIYANGTVRFSGNVTITGNAIGGVWLTNSAKVTLSGTPVITGNTKQGEPGTPYNLAREGAAITVEGVLSSGAQVGVTDGAAGDDVAFADSADPANAPFFTDDGKTYEVKAEGGKLYWSAKLPVARIGDTTYLTLQEAVAAVPVGSASATAIEILRDFSITQGVTVDNKKIILTSAAGGPYTISRGVGAAGNIVFVTMCGGSSLTMSNLTLDGAKELNARNAQAFRLESGSSLTLEGGAVLQNFYWNGTGSGTVLLYGDGSLTMNEGAVIRNNTATYGAAVTLYHSGTNNSFTMTGGSITGNHSLGRSGYQEDPAFGAVHVGDGTFTMSGGSITGNTGDGAAMEEQYRNAGHGSGVSIYGTKNAKVDLSGDAVVEGNTFTTADGRTVADNIYIGFQSPTKPEPAGTVNLAGSFTGRAGLALAGGITGGNAAGYVFGAATEGSTGAGNIVNDVNGGLVGQVSGGDLLWAAADLYVSSTGSDETGLGTAEKPYETVDKAIDMAASGSTIHIMDRVEVPKSKELPADTELTITGTDQAGQPYPNAMLVATGNMHAGDSVYGMFRVGYGAELSIDHLTIDGGNIGKTMGRVWYDGTLNLNEGTVVRNFVDQVATVGKDAKDVDTVNLSGHVVLTGNGGGIWMYTAGARLNLSGRPEIYDNISAAGQQNNVKLHAGRGENIQITVTGTMDQGARVGVTDGAADENVIFAVNDSAEAANANLDKFFADNGQDITVSDGVNLVWGGKVARVLKPDGTSTNYYTLQAAADAAGPGDVVELLRDTSENVTISTSFDALDWAGHTLTGGLTVGGESTVGVIRNTVDGAQNFVTGGIKGALTIKGTVGEIAGGRYHATTNEAVPLLSEGGSPAWLGEISGGWFTGRNLAITWYGSSAGKTVITGGVFDQCGQGTLGAYGGDIPVENALTLKGGYFGSLPQTDENGQYYTGGTYNKVYVTGTVEENPVSVVGQGGITEADNSKKYYPVMAETVARTSNDGGKTWTEFDTVQKAVDAVDADGNTVSIVELLRDVKLTETVRVTDGTFTLRSDSRVSKRYTILRGKADFYLMQVGSGANVTFTDVVLDGNKANFAPTRRDGNTSGLLNVSGGSATLGDGAILQNNDGGRNYTFTTAGAVRVYANGRLVMEDGAVIRNNTVDRYAGAILLGTDDTQGHFEMYGGVITGNTTINDVGKGSWDYGGTICAWGGSMTMTGGSITGNTVINTSAVEKGTGAGVMVNKNVPFTVSGNAVIAGNTVTNRAANTSVSGNVYLGPTAATITLDGAFTGSIGVTEGAATGNQAGSVFGTAQTGSTGAGNFFNDVDGTLSGVLDGTALKWSAPVARTSNDGGRTWTGFATVQEAVDASSGTDSIVELLTDVTLTQTVTVAAGKNFTLRSDSEGSATYSLNRGDTFLGHMLNLTGAKVRVENLILDGKGIPLQSSYTIVYAGGGSELTLSDGAVVQNQKGRKTDTGTNSAVYVNGSKLFVEHGAVLRWNQGEYGAAITLYNNSIGYMTGGEIYGNYATRDNSTYGGSGAVEVWGSTLHMSGGRIYGNGAVASNNYLKDAVGGVCVEADGTLVLSGDAEIVDNYICDNQNLTSGVYTGGTPANVHIRNGGNDDEIQLKGAFTGRVGITQNEAIAGANQAGSVFGTAETGSTGAGNFFNDVTGLMGTMEGGILKWAEGGAVARTSNDGGKSWTEYATLQEAVDAVDGSTKTDSYVELLRNLNVDSGISTGKVFTLRSGTRDGDGQYTLKRGAGFNGIMLTVSANAQVTLTDLILDGNRAENPKGTAVTVNVAEGGALTLGSGAILQNNLNAAGNYTSGAVYGQPGSTIRIEEGAVLRWNEAQYGSAVTSQGGVIYMTGGEIYGNYANRVSASNGGAGAMSAWGGGTIHLSGGSITGNGAAQNAGGIVIDGAEVNISGDVVVKDNFITSDKNPTLTGGRYESGTQANLRVSPTGTPDANILRLAGEFTGSVGVTQNSEGAAAVENANQAGTEFGVNAENHTGAKHFFNDVNDKLVGGTVDGKLVWGESGVARTSNDGGKTWTLYPTLQAAVYAVELGDATPGENIVELLQNTTEKEILLAGDYRFTLRSSTRPEEAGQRFTATLDKGYTGSGSTDLFELQGCTVTMENINLDGDGEARRENGRRPSKLLSVKGSTVTLKNVTISGNYGNAIGQAAVYVDATGKLNLSGSVYITGSYAGDDLWLTNDSQLTLTGDFTGAVNVTEGWNDATNAEGEQFGVANDNSYTGAERFVNAADPSLVGEIQDGRLVWKKLTGAVARVNNGENGAWVEYPTLASAVASLKNDGDTVELLRDVTENGAITSDKDFTLQSGTRAEDGGKTYTVKRGLAITLLTLTGDVTLKNIVLDGGAVYDPDKADDVVWWAGVTGITGGAVMVSVDGGSLTMDEGAKLCNAARPGGSTYGAALLLNDADLTMNTGSSIERNLVATHAPAIRALGASQVNIHGGEIKRNACTASQGIVMLWGTSGLTMTSGAIKDNYGSWYCGAVLTMGTNAVDLSGGEITGNRSGTSRAPAGVNINATSTLTLSGGITIYDNVTSTGAQANLTLGGEGVLTVNGALTGKVGVTDRWTGAQNVAGEVFGIGIDAAGLESLTNDADSVLRAVLENGMVKWANPKVAKIVGGMDNGKTYATLAAAIADYDSDASYILMIADSTEKAIAVDRTVYVDLAGFTVAADVKVNSGNVFHGFDTTTNGYDAETEDDFGHIIGTVSGSGSMAATTSTGKAQTAQDMRYVAVSDGDDTSFHRFDMKLGTVVFRPSAAGIYFKSEFYGDTWVKDEIRNNEALTYGLFLGITADTRPDAGNAAAHDPDSFQTGKEGDKHQGSMVKDIVVEGNSDNADRTNTPIYVSTYFNFEDAGVVADAMKSVTLTKVVELTARQYNAGSLNEVQKRDFEAFWEKFKDLYPNITVNVPEKSKQDEQ